MASAKATNGQAALFLDRDGTLTRDRGYTYRVEDLEWLEGAQDAIASANRAGALVVIVTNQSGIGRSYFTLAEMHAYHDAMREDLNKIGAHIDAIYFCPYVAEADVPQYRAHNHPDRKPNPGMVLRAIKDLSIAPGRSLMVGDQDTDLQAASRAGVPALRATGVNLAALITPWVVGLAQDLH